MTHQALIARSLDLFAAWSSGDADAPREYLHADAVLADLIGGTYRGWPDIRDYFANGLKRYPDLTLVPTGNFWHRKNGLALTWVMSATNTNLEFGADTVGRRWQAEGMSHLTFDDGLVIAEYDYHDAGSRRRSLLEPQ